MRMIFWSVYYKGRCIDRVPYNESCTKDYVHRSLVEHDGYPSGIVVRTERKKKTRIS